MHRQGLELHTELTGTSLKHKAWEEHGLLLLAPSNEKYQKEASLGHVFQGWEKREDFFSELFSLFCIERNSFEPLRRSVGGQTCRGNSHSSTDTRCLCSQAATVSPGSAVTHQGPGVRPRGSQGFVHGHCRVPAQPRSPGAHRGLAMDPRWLWPLPLAQPQCPGQALDELCWLGTGSPALLPCEITLGGSQVPSQSLLLPAGALGAMW